MVENETPTRAVILQTCREIAADKGAPPAARVQAARTLAEMAGLLGRVQQGALDMGETRHAEMSADDIDRELARLQQQRAAPDTKAK